MHRLISCVLLYVFLGAAPGMCGPFDERLWEKYCEIDTSAMRGAGTLAAVYLEPQQVGEINTTVPFADFRLITEQKEEIPWQIILRRPEMSREEIPAQMRNLSLTGNNETWFELMVGKQVAGVNGLEVITPDSDFSRQTQIFGSPDGNTWNVLRKDGVIFDVGREEKLRRTRIYFPETNYRHLAVKITNGEAKPLTISSVKVLRGSYAMEQIYTISGTIEKSEIDKHRQESRHAVRMAAAFPIDRLVIHTKERNFHRALEVQVKRGAGDWEPWAQGTIFSFESATIRESHLSVDIPEISAREFRLVFKDFDNPPLVLTDVAGAGYRRLLVFKQQPNHKLYLFWGNPQAQQPRYDLAMVMTRQKTDEIPVASLGEVRQNTKFAGKNARLPFTERYKYLLYVVIVFAIIALVMAQYRVLRRVNRSEGSEGSTDNKGQDSTTGTAVS